jgi:8-oxo-dGTP pyrophosphatase MutT (NUDIX family)
MSRGYTEAMADSQTRWRKPRQQYAALPFRRAKGGSAEIMLITSRDTGRWVIPKGWPIRGLKPSATAAREALEEAGLVGQIAKRPLGSFTYEKKLDEGLSVVCTVEVFPFKVKGQRKSWPEKKQRRGRWFAAEEAAEAVAEPDLGALIERFARKAENPSPERPSPGTSPPETLVPGESSPKKRSTKGASPKVAKTKNRKPKTPKPESPKLKGARPEGAKPDGAPEAKRKGKRAERREHV